MNLKMREYLPGVLNGLTGIGVLIVSFWVDHRLPIPKEAAKPLGIFIVFIGMSLVVWAIVHIREAIMGDVEPILKVLVKEGPYRFVRHPVYLGMTIALIGVAVALRSLLGLIGVFLLYLPSGVYRAKLEEKALAQKFGAEWENYTKQTGFILPIPGKK
ncbi:MAG: methyltransferase family protein [Methanosarcinales archaeon]